MKRQAGNSKIFFKKTSSSGTRKSNISLKLFNVLKAYTLIAQNAYPAVDQLMEKFEVSRRTIYRYLEIINMIDTIELDKVRNGYKFSDANVIKKMLLSDEEFLLLLTLGETVSHLGDTLKTEFQKFIDHFINIAIEPKTGHIAPIVVKIPDAFENDHMKEHFKTISKSISQRRSIIMRYKARDSRKDGERKIDPYGLVFYEGVWILIGYCHLREGLRRFALDRIIDIKETCFAFKLQEGFDFKEHLSRSWGIYDEKEVKIKVRFSASIADLITRRKSWHPTEKRVILPNGDVELTFRVNGISEIKKWVYMWLPEAEILEPQWLRGLVRTELKAGAEKHT